MIDTWGAERALDKFTEGIPDEVWSDGLRELAKRLQYEIEGIECEEDHVNDESTVLDGSKVIEYVADLQTRVRMGTYDPKMHGTLEEVLDEIERLLR